MGWRYRAPASQDLEEYQFDQAKNDDPSGNVCQNEDIPEPSARIIGRCRQRRDVRLICDHRLLR